MSDHPQRLGEPRASLLLPYAIEVEIPGGNTPRRIATATSIAIGYAAFFAAARERPDAEIVLRQGDQVLQRMPPGLG